MGFDLNFGQFERFANRLQSGKGGGQAGESAGERTERRLELVGAGAKTAEGFVASAERLRQTVLQEDQDAYALFWR